MSVFSYICLVLNADYCYKWLIYTLFFKKCHIHWIPSSHGQREEVLSIRVVRFMVDSQMPETTAPTEYSSKKTSMTCGGRFLCKREMTW